MWVVMSNELEVVVMGAFSEKIGNKTKNVWYISSQCGEFYCSVKLAALFAYLVTAPFCFIFKI